MTIVPYQVKVGAAEVYFSGSVTCRPGHIVEISPVAPPGTFKLRIAFIETPGAAASWTRLNQPDNGVLITFTNFGTGPSANIQPIHVGMLGTIPLLLDLVGSASGDDESSMRTITYTVLIGNP